VLELKADRRYPLLLMAVFLSGASALMFETLWFRLCGLMLGNGVWLPAWSSLVS
jgi:predicted membrane-bound spermidine synthase